MSIDSTTNVNGGTGGGGTATSTYSAVSDASVLAGIAQAAEAAQAGIAKAAEAAQAGIAKAVEAAQTGVANVVEAAQAEIAKAAEAAQVAEDGSAAGGRVLPSYAPEPYSPKPYTPPAYNPPPYTPEPYVPGTIKSAKLIPVINHNVPPETVMPSTLTATGGCVRPTASAPVTDFGMFADKGLSTGEIQEVDQRETTLKGAIKALALPEVSVGEAYRQLLCLFTPANHFKEKFAIQSVQADTPDFKVTLESEKGLVLVEGIAGKPGTVKLLFKYRTLDQGRYSWGRNMVNELEKEIVVKLDEASQKEQGLLDSLANNLPLKNRAAKTGEEFSVNIEFAEFFTEEYSPYLTIESASLENADGLVATLEGSNLLITGVPVKDGEAFLRLQYKLQTRFDGSQSKEFRGKLMDILPDPIMLQEREFKKQLHTIAIKKVVAGEQLIAPVVVSLPSLAAFTRIKVVGFSLDDGGSLSVEYAPANGTVTITGIAMTAKENPKAARTVEVVCHYQLEKASGETEELDERVPVLFINPNPKDLWNDLPTDDNAPYQSPNKEHECLNFGKTLIAASKRGRSHAHDGKFRDDYYKVEHLAETGWTIVAVSDGAGSAVFSRKGARIACETFCELLKARLALKEVDDKLLGMPAEEQEKALKGAVLKAAYEGMVNIDKEAQSKGEPRKKYAATFLGYVLKKIGEEWLIVSIGIGDGIISLLDKDGNLTLLSEPDGGEFVGQTRFITMNEVWQDNPAKRLHMARVPDFTFIMSMTDGVSDPKFETDNNLKTLSIWEKLWGELSKTLPLQERSEATAQALEDWLDFWAKGNHDDRTIAVVY